MALTVQNKNFLSLLNRLDIDVKQFSDKTFDGLFENVPDDAEYFFNWFIENITPDNVLTQSEQATYFQLETTQTLPQEDEINYVLSSCNPDFNELMSLNVNYVNSFLPQELDDLSKNYKELSDILAGLEDNFNEITKKQNNLKEKLAVRKKQLESEKQEFHKTDSHFVSKLNDIKTLLLKEPHFLLDIDSFNSLVEMEESIFSKFKECKLFENKLFNSSELDMLPTLETDAAYNNISMILCEGSLKEKKLKIEFLRDLIEKKSTQKGFDFHNSLQSYLISNEGMESKLFEEIKILEREVFEKIKILSHHEVEKILAQYLSQVMELREHQIEKLSICKDYLESNRKTNSWLLQVVLNCMKSVEKTHSSKKQLYSKLSEYERSYSNDITNLELRNQRFKEVTAQQAQHPLMLALSNITSLQANPENNEETFKNIYESMSFLKDDSNFISFKFRNDLQASIKMLFDNTLCGPTSELLFAPAELILKLQNCEEQEAKLVQVVKRLANKYVDAKTLISKSDRKKLLSWIDLLINPQNSQKVVNSTES